MPRDGWLRTVRQALGMRLIDVARRIGASEAAVRQSERGEIDGRITISQVTRLANALGCDFAYALIPRVPLERQFEHRVHQLAARDSQRVARSMSLERQDIDPRLTEQHRAELVAQYLRTPPKDLWNE